MKKVLILTYYWPPGSGPGVQRWLKFCKYLPEYGWEPTVITVKDGSYPSTDSSLENDIPDGLKVYKTNSLEPFGIYNALRGKKGKSVEVAMASVKGKQSPFSRFANYIRSNYFIPDARVGWNTYSFPTAIKVIKENRPDVIITTGPPHSTHLVGQRLQKMYNIPWIADFRDPWTSIYYNQFLLRTEASKKKDQRLENEVLRDATSIITATPGMKAEFEARTQNIHFLTNGYDEDDFSKTSDPQNEKFTIAYVGNFKPNQNIDAFWSALSQLRDSFEGEFVLQITGNVADEVKSSIESANLQDAVEILPFVPHKESIQRMMSAHVLLLPIPRDASSKLILTGKIFEYLATRRPILSIGPRDGNAAAILKECGKEAMLDYEDSNGMQSMLTRLMSEWKKGEYVAATGNDSFANYSRKGVTSGLAEILNDLSQ